MKIQRNVEKIRLTTYERRNGWTEKPREDNLSLYERRHIIKMLSNIVQMHEITRKVSKTRLTWYVVLLT